MSHLPVWLASAWMAGVALGAARPPWARPAVLVAVGAWLALGLAWRLRRGRAMAALASVALAGLGVGAGASALQRATAPSLVRVLDREGLLPAYGGRAVAAVHLEGRLLADAQPAAFATLLRVAAERIHLPGHDLPAPVEGSVTVAVAGHDAVRARSGWRAGRRLSMVVFLRRPTRARNPGAPGEARDAARRRAALVGAVKSALVVETTGRGPWVSEAAADVRARARRAIARAAGPDAAEAAAVGTAVLIGDRAGLSAELQDRLQRAGTFHVIAISGGNIALWAVLAAWLAGRVTAHRAAALGATAAAVVAYAYVVGGGASVLRASGMAVVGVTARWLDQRAAALNVLAATSGVLVAVDPLVVADVGFWLTTAATAGLVLGLPADRPASRARAWGRALVLTSVAAEGALLPIVASVFQQVSVAGLAASAVAVPAMAVVQGAALAAVLADAVAPPLVWVAGGVLRAATLAVTESARLVDVMPWLAWKVPPPSIGAVAAYYVSLAAWLWARSRLDASRARPVRRAAAVAVPLAACWVAVSPATLLPRAPGRLEVTALDVGQGDAIYVAFPNGRRMLVDAGGLLGDGGDLGARVVGPALRALGVRRLDYLVVSHPDADHLGGAAAIVREFRPAEVWSGIDVPGHEPTARLQREAARAGASWREVRRGDRLVVGGVDLTVRHPDRPQWERPRVRNDDSIVCDLTYGRVRIVLSGDAGQAVEEALTADARDGPAPPPFTVLKVAHHGSASASSQAWLEHLRPTIALVSAGAANAFGHPAPAVLARLQRVGASVWRTDLDGAITVATDGLAVAVRSATGREAAFAAQPR
ncbi:MAG: DNA internalization-related competence protein ComEC/Rec2 [Vicinamibacterales bacterium]